MKKTSELPQAVRNLRAIWDQKKIEMQFTQVEAAKELGWSQGAISHYLNAITDLGYPAVIKFANFLDVSPLAIDPSIVEHLPNIMSMQISGSTSNINKVNNQMVYVKAMETARYLWTSKGMRVYQDGGFVNWPENTSLRVSDVKEAPNSYYYLVVKKGETAAHVYHNESLPPANKIKKQLAISAFTFPQPMKYSL
jgi:transcriptional regulator with XRE-family HTH domain